MKGKSFTTGLITGAMVGGMMGIIMDPAKDKKSTQIKKSTSNVFRSVGTMVDTIMDMKK